MTPPDTRRVLLRGAGLGAQVGAVGGVVLFVYVLVLDWEPGDNLSLLPFVVVFAAYGAMVGVVLGLAVSAVWWRLTITGWGSPFLRRLAAGVSAPLPLLAFPLRTDVVFLAIVAATFAITSFVLVPRVGRPVAPRRPAPAEDPG